MTAKTSVTRPQDTRHTTHTDAHTALTHTSTRTALLVRKPLSTAGHAAKGPQSRGRAPARALLPDSLGLHRKSAPAFAQVNIGFRTAKTDEKETIKRQISLHRFKPVIFSKMIQNCLNQVEGRWLQ